MHARRGAQHSQRKRDPVHRHYMAQLDDRDKLARRVAELQRQEEKLLLR
jgi:hypothetical protein